MKNTHFLQLLQLFVREIWEMAVTLYKLGLELTAITVLTANG
jgi:hypothetical protein